MSRSNFLDKYMKAGWCAATARLSLYALVLLLPVGTRKLMSQFTPGFDEYETVWLYASDIACVVFLVCAWWGGVVKRLNVSTRVRVALAVFALSALFSVAFAPLKILSAIAVLRVLVLLAVAVVMRSFIGSGEISRRVVLVLFGLGAALQSCIALFQFAYQRSVGLGLLGESTLGIGPGHPGTAKIMVEGGQLLRAYGTFPHPNMLGAFLIIGLLSLCELFLLNMNRAKGGELFGRWMKLPRVNYATVMILAGINLTIFGLVLSFSRTAWVVTTLAIAMLFVGMWAGRKRYGISGASLAALAIALTVLSGTIAYEMGWAISPRARMVSTEPAVTYRISYNDLGFSLIDSHPFGVGAGNSVFFAVKNGIYGKMGMPFVWQWQPIHNIYLLVATEVGIAGLVALLVALWGMAFTGKEKGSSVGRRTVFAEGEFFVARVMLAALLVFGLFDHFFWTLQQGRLMFWLAVGLLAVSVKSGIRLRKRK